VHHHKEVHHVTHRQNITTIDQSQESPVAKSADQDRKKKTGEKEPKLFVDVNVANFGLQRIVVYDGDTVESLVTDFVKRCPIDEFMIEKLKLLLQQQMDGVLERIDEDEVVEDSDEEAERDNATPVHNAQIDGKIREEAKMKPTHSPLSDVNQSGYSVQTKQTRTVSKGSSKYQTINK